MKIEVHELARRLPPMAYKDYEALRDDIKLNGQHVPIVKWKGKIIDGAHRLKACQELGVKPQIVVWHGKEEELAAYVRGVNIPRRHLTVSQKAMYGMREMLGVERKRIKEREKIRKLRRRNTTTPEMEKSLEESGEAKSAAAVVAEELRISASMIYKAQAIQEADKKLANAVFRGEMTLGQAERQVRTDEAGTDKVKEMTDPVVVKEKTEEGRARARWFATVLREEIEKDEDWKVAVGDGLKDEAYLRMGTRLRWRLEEEVG